MTRFVSFLFLAFLFACQPTSPEQKAPLSFNEIAKIDFHTHYRHDSKFLEPLFDEWNMQTLLVEVSRDDSSGVHRYWDHLKAMQVKHPDRYFLCSGFNAFGIDEPDYVQNIIARLDKEIGEGARLVKVWKNFGMVDKDANGEYVQIDDPRLQPIWNFLIEKNIPVLAHIAEPIQAWRPLQEGNPHYNYYKNNPQYHAYHHPEIPTWETIIAARDNWIGSNPNLTVVGAHMGSMSHDVGIIAQRLDKYPNFYVEPAARFGDLTGQESEKVRAFFLKYQDRILYGTDLGSSPPAGEVSPEDLASQEQYIRRMLELHWEYFSGTDSLYYDSPMISFPVETHSLALPDSVLKKVYLENARKLLNRS